MGNAVSDTVYKIFIKDSYLTTFLNKYAKTEKKHNLKSRNLFLYTLQNENDFIKMAKGMVNEQFQFTSHYTRELKLPYIEEYCHHKLYTSLNFRIFRKELVVFISKKFFFKKLYVNYYYNRK